MSSELLARIVAMGVTGLWTVVQPCARPIKLETLNRKRLAVDASIWIYQFLKAVRDREGNALRNSHVVGFFRRICKLLFFGIKPIFVFDGGAPILKRQTVSSRKARREGRREDAIRTAGKLLAVQMQRRAEEEDMKRREEHERPGQDEEDEEIPDNVVYVDELHMTKQERQQNRTFRKKDAYHLPNLDVDLTNMGAPNDPRIMSHEELEEYARQFHTGEEVNVYDFSKIDFESPFFQSLPATDRYNILNAARLRSRLRMGYSKEQLDTMFPNRMDFSKFQIDRVKERNELTQRLMNLNGMNGEDAMASINSGGRIAGEKGKEYVLVKNDGVEGGWALGVVSNNQEGQRNKPIDVETFDRNDEADEVDNEGWDEDGFEDVPIEGLNRLPRKSTTTAIAQLESEETRKKRKALYRSRDKASGQERLESSPQPEPESLFVPQQANGLDPGSDKEDEEADELFEDVEVPKSDEESEEERLRQAIAMSLEDQDSTQAENSNLRSFASAAKSGPRIDQPLQFNSRNAKAGRDFAHLANSRAHGSAPKPFFDDSDEEEALDLQAALKESRRSMHRPKGGPRVHGFKRPDAASTGGLALSSPPSKSANSTAKRDVSQQPSRFSGPLPFESINLGTSILGQKKKTSPEPEPGGFEKSDDKEKAPKPIPPWFSGDIREASAKQKALEEKQSLENKKDQPGIEFESIPPVLQRHETNEIIDLEAPADRPHEVVDLERVEEEDQAQISLSEDAESVLGDVTMGDIADLTRAEPPVPDKLTERKSPSEDAKYVEGNVTMRDIADLAPSEPPVPNKSTEEHSHSVFVSQKQPEKVPSAAEDDSAHEDAIEWSESEAEEDTSKQAKAIQGGQDSPKQTVSEDLPSAVRPAEDNSVTELDAEDKAVSPGQPDTAPEVPALPQESSTNLALLDEYQDGEVNEFSDPEEEELMRQMATEAEEHARFASELNSKSQMQSAEDYEKELRQLRNQQKKDRRDADEVTHIMVTECQQLLRLFGLPYITAPMEAEAQCAELVSLGLVDGIVTDDSDIFLFGGTRIYKNMFNQAKFVECYLASDLEKEYSLDRQKLIRFAHLLGSDYTEGLPSVGPVTALEILSEFETLEQFAEWWSTVQLGQPLSAADAAIPFRRKFRKNASKIFLPNPFPDTRVDYAYLHPEVDSDPQAFQWGVPDLDSLRQFLMATIGWSQERTDEVLVPVIRDMNRRDNEGTQANITQFFSGGVGLGSKPTSDGSGGQGNQAFAPRRRVENKSQRMETALGRLHKRAQERSHGEGDVSQAVEQNDSEQTTTNGSRILNAHETAKNSTASQAKPTRTRKHKRVNTKPDEENDGGSQSSETDEYEEAPTKSRKTTKGGRREARAKT